VIFNERNITGIAYKQPLHAQGWSCTYLKPTVCSSTDGFRHSIKMLKKKTEIRSTLRSTEVVQGQMQDTHNRPIAKTVTWDKQSEDYTPTDKHHISNTSFLNALYNILTCGIGPMASDAVSEHAKNYVHVRWWSKRKNNVV
jgi:hypothetical protein